MGEVTFNHVFSHTDSTGRLSMGPAAHQQALPPPLAGLAGGGMQQGAQLQSPLLVSELQLPTGPREATDEEDSEVPKSQPGSAEPESAAGIDGLRSAMQRNLEAPVQAGITPTGLCTAASTEAAGLTVSLLTGHRRRCYHCQYAQSAMLDVCRPVRHHTAPSQPALAAFCTGLQHLLGFGPLTMVQEAAVSRALAEYSTEMTRPCLTLARHACRGHHRAHKPAPEQHRQHREPDRAPAGR